jgi:hypothetical protein
MYLAHVFLLSQVYDAESKEIKDVSADSMLAFACWHLSCW